MTEYVKTATQFLIEARRWQLETIKEQTAAADALLKQQKAQLEERDHILRDLKRQLKRKKALVDIARSYTLCLDKKAKLDAQWNELSEEQRATPRLRKARRLVKEKHAAYMGKLERFMRQNYLRNPEWGYPEAFMIKQGFASHEMRKGELSV